MTKRIALVLPNMTGGGAERVALASAADLLARGHEVDLVLLEARGELLPLVAADARVVDLRTPRGRSAVLPLARYLRERRPDALHAFMWPLTIIAILAHRLARSKARLMVSDHTVLSQHVASALHRRFLGWTTRLFYPAADHRIVVSEQAGRDLERCSGIAFERFEVITNPISPPTTIARDPEVERLWGGDESRILTVGNLKPEKNHALLLRAFAKLEDRSARLMIVGEGMLRAELCRLAEELGISERVIMPGFALDPWPFYASADLFVLSSNYEGFPLVLAEAMYAGLPIVSTDCPTGPAQMLANGEFGRLAPLADPDALAKAMAALLAEPVDRQLLRDRAMEMAGPSQLARYQEILTAD